MSIVMYQSQAASDAVVERSHKRFVLTLLLFNFVFFICVSISIWWGTTPEWFGNVLLAIFAFEIAVEMQYRITRWHTKQKQNKK